MASSSRTIIIAAIPPPLIPLWSAVETEGEAVGGAVEVDDVGEAAAAAAAVVVVVVGVEVGVVMVVVVLVVVVGSLRLKW